MGGKTRKIGELPDALLEEDDYIAIIAFHLPGKQGLEPIQEGAKSLGKTSWQKTAYIREFMMTVDCKKSYRPPVDKLLTCGVNDWITPDKWPDYRELGIGPEHIPDLIQMATDEELHDAGAQSTEVWAPMHAWRALGQLRAVEAVEPLLGLFSRLEDDDWVDEELPDVFGMIGPAALPALAEYMTDLPHSVSSRISVITSIEKIVKRWPGARGECLALLENRLERFEENEPLVNGFLVLALVKLGAKEAAPLIKRAFDAGYVDTMVVGDWAEVQRVLGRKEAGLTSIGFLKSRLEGAPIRVGAGEERTWGGDACVAHGGETPGISPA